MIIFVNNGKYVYRYANYDLVLRKQTNNVTMKIMNKSEHKCYSMELTESQLANDEYFQSIKNEYNVLELFGLSNVELFCILVDNSMKKNKYNIEWYKITPLNIRNDSIKIKISVSPSIELSFALDFSEYI
jgi:hypothetical protein